MGNDFTSNLSTNHAFHVEVHGVLHGLKVIWNYGIRKLVIEIDSLFYVK